MKRYPSKSPILSLFFIFLVAYLIPSHAQIAYTQSGESYITVAGTSTLHEWTMTSLQAGVQASFQMDEKGVPSQLKSLSVSVPSESLKSAHKAMDKNAYSALKVNKFKNIGFTLSSVSTQNEVFQCVGNLSIAGVTKSISLDATCKQKDKSFRCTGSKAIKMSDFQVEAPSFMFGTVKTGDEITISFNIDLQAAKN
jgi:polyisoprenoid-binding protein YceI